MRAEAGIKPQPLYLPPDAVCTNAFCPVLFPTLMRIAEEVLYYRRKEIRGAHLGGPYPNELPGKNRRSLIRIVNTADLEYNKEAKDEATPVRAVLSKC